jgi:uncharacterized protein (TIGR03083 family)
MTDLGFDQLAVIEEHSAGLAAVVPGRLALPVPGCPGWHVADLVAHVTEVQWFWATIVEDRLAEPPDEDRRPARAPDPELVSALTTQTARLLRALRDADPRTPVWTWAATQQDVAFIARHQVQEAAVHHWDAGRAAGRLIVIEPAVAVDSIDEFLNFSVSSDADPADPARPPLDGTFALRCTDVSRGWTVGGGQTPGTVRVEAGAVPGVPAVEGTAADLLLWLYRRVRLQTPVPAALLNRFSALTYTD